MKKQLILMVMVLMGTYVMAQEKPSGFELGGNVGVETLNNYSAVSLFRDGTATYSAMSEAIYVGYVKNGRMIGLQLRAASFVTSAVDLNELAAKMDLSLMLRRYFPILHHLEPFMGMSFGGSMVNNHFEMEGSELRMRYGIFLGFEGGLSYRFGNGSSLGLRVNYDLVGSFVGKKPTISAPLLANERNGFEGFGLSMQFTFPL